VTGPVSQVVYEVAFTFALRDADGFVLQTVTDRGRHLSSGRTNRFQSIAPQQISATTARQVARIDVDMRVTRCETCRSSRREK
jgi:hypothetical protein